jgi:hypothetical protein
MFAINVENISPMAAPDGHFCGIQFQAVQQ